MTIHNRELNERLSNAEACCENAPENSYIALRRIISVVHDTSNGILAALKANGLKTKNSDSLRDLEAAIYGYITKVNPELDSIPSGEGFGWAMNEPCAERVKAQAFRDSSAIDKIIGMGA